MGEQPGKPADVVDRLIRILGALDRLAQDGGYHAPLTPDSIRFLDDGSAAIDPAPRPEPGQTFIVNNPAYLAPECLFEPPYEPAAVARADIYALGHIAFEWLAGRSAYLSRFPAGVSDSKLKWMQWHGDPVQKLPRPADVASWIPAPLSDLLEQMAAKAATERPQSYADLIERLEAIRKRVEDTRHIDAKDVSQARESSSAEHSVPLRNRIAVGAGIAVLALILWFSFCG